MPADVDLPGVLRGLHVLAGDAPRRRGTLDRTWYDTFDWALHRAGLRLEHRRSDGVLTLREAATGAVQGCLELAEVPRFPAGLPPGDLRIRLATVTGLRALLPVARVRSSSTTGAVLDGERKTVARVVVEDPTLVRPRTALQRRVRVVALRGYDAEAATVAARLPAELGLVPAGDDLATAAMTATGRRPGEYSAKLRVDLDEDMRADAAVVRILTTLLDALQENLAGTLAAVDTEFLHDFRVAVRRTRSALKLLGDAAPGEAADRFAAEFRWLGDVTTPTRDLDVHLLSLAEMGGWLRAGEPGDLEPLRELVTERQRREQARLVRALRSARFTALVRNWRALLEEDLPAAGSRGPAGEPVRVVADDRLAATWRRVRRRGDRIEPGSPAEALHDLRKRCKELRYLLEFFVALYPPEPYRRVIATLRDLQDDLGRFQDSEVQRTAIRGFATELAARDSADVRTFLALGEVSGVLARMQDEAREEFATRWAQFRAPRTRRAARDLLGGRAG